MPRVRIDIDPRTVTYHEWDAPEWEDEELEDVSNWEDEDHWDDLEDYEEDA